MRCIPTLKEIESDSQTPEQLMLLLDAQLAAQRARRKKPPERNRVVFLVFSVLFIIAATAAAFMMLEWMVANSPLEGHRATQSGTASERKF